PFSSHRPLIHFFPLPSPMMKRRGGDAADRASPTLDGKDFIMVDADTVATPRLRTRPDTRREVAMCGSGAPIVVEVRAADATALSGYDAFCRSGLHGPAQHPLWVRAWIEAHGSDALIVTARRDGKALLKLALEVVAKGPLRVARFVGGIHAHGNFAAVAPDMAAASPADGAAIAGAPRQARPHLDRVGLRRR